MLRGGLQRVRVVMRAMALLRLDAGVRAPQVGLVVPLTDEAIRRIADWYSKGGGDRALFDRPRPAWRNF